MAESSVVFASQPGTLKVLQIDRGAGGLVQLEGATGGAALTTVLITELSAAHAVLVQFRQTLKDAIYVYSFGDRMGTINVGGLCFFRLCDEENAYQGWKEVIEFYRSNKVSTLAKSGPEQEKKVRVTIGGQTASGYLVEMATRTVSAENKIFGFNYVIATLPDGFTSTGAAAPAGAAVSGEWISPTGVPESEAR